MSPEISSATLRLFDAIEGGNPFWSNEISLHGSDEVLSRIVAGSYDQISDSASKIRMRLEKSTLLQLQQRIADSGALFLTNESNLWPVQLESLEAPPLGLVVKGDLNLLTRLDRSISIVGTRNPSTYGIRVAGDFAIGASDHDWTIISGGAFGIDATAHRATLLNEGVTVAVLAGGFERNYPAAHTELFEQISQQGLLITEVMPEVPAEPFRFLTRNRLIAALSRGTVVVEAAYRSGSLRTARDAAEIFRQVMAVPGPINSPTSEGCHRLIAERSAELVTSITDVLELVNPLGS